MYKNFKKQIGGAENIKIINPLFSNYICSKDTSHSYDDVKWKYYFAQKNPDQTYTINSDSLTKPNSGNISQYEVYSCKPREVLLQKDAIEVKVLTYNVFWKWMKKPQNRNNVIELINRYKDIDFVALQ